MSYLRDDGRRMTDTVRGMEGQPAELRAVAPFQGHNFSDQGHVISDFRVCKDTNDLNLKSFCFGK